MGGVGGWLSPLLTASTNTVGAYEGAQADANERRQQDVAKQIQLLRQQHNDEIENALKAAQTKGALRTAAAPVEGSQEDIAAKVALARGLIAPKVEEKTALIPGTVAEQTALIPGKVAEQTALIPGKVAEQGALTPGLVKRAGATANAEVPAKVAVAKATADYAAPVSAVDPVTHETKFYTRSGALGKDKAPAGGGQNAPQMAAAKTNLESARKTMDTFEEALRNGTAEYGPFDATKGAMGSSEQAQTATGKLGALESLAANYAGASLREKNPSLSEYLKAKKFVAEAILNTHKRPNQTQYEIEQELSGIGPRMDGFKSPEAASQIAQSKDRRDRMYNEVFGGAGTAPTAPTAATGAPGGDVNLGAPPKVATDTRDAATRQADRVRAAKEPAFKQWLVDHGLQP